MSTDLKKELQEFTSSFDKQLIIYFKDRFKSEKSVITIESNRHLKDYLLAGGKRLRPFILAKTNQEFRQINHLEPVLMAFEFLHNSTLIDDDIIDEHKVRRNNPTLLTTYNQNNIIGDFAAVLISNNLFNYGLELISNSYLDPAIKKEFIKSYLEISKSVNDAQLMDLTYRGRFNLSEKEYLHKIELVAAKFIAELLKLGSTKENHNAFYEIGKNLGMAFQLADDLMDIDEKKQKGRPIGADIRERTPTLLSIYTYHRLNRKDKAHFEKIFGQKKILPTEVKWVIEQYQKSGAIDDVKKKMGSYVEKSNKLVSSLGLPKDHWLFAFGEYSLNRVN